jgi:mono/diheme cytochrome c family protein
MLRPLRLPVRRQVLPLLGVLALGAGAAFATDPPPAGAPPAGTGRDLFTEKCGMCHRSSGMGTGLLARRYPKGQEQLETRSNLSAALVTSVVRHGLNNMPALSRAEVSDAQLATVASYLSRGNP